MFAQGANSCSFDPNGTGVKAIGYDTAAANVTVIDKHILTWVNIGSVENNTFANGGQRIRISTNLMSAGTLYGDYYCGGNDKNIAAVKGAWIRLCADVHKNFDASATPPSLSGVRSIGAVWNVLSVPAGINALCAADQIAYGTGVTISGGAATPRGSPEIAANDRTNGRGMFKNADGVYYALGRVTIGDTLGNSTFEDTGKVWNFEDQAVSAAFHKLEFIGGAAYTNLATFGIKSGSGSTAEASAGNTFLSGGSVPFRIEATDSNMNTVGFYGCNFIGPSGIMLDNLRQFYYSDASIPNWIDLTRAAGNTATADTIFMPAHANEAIDDCAYYGYPEKFQGQIGRAHV